MTTTAQRRESVRTYVRRDTSVPITGPLRLEVAKLWAQTHVVVLLWICLLAPVGLVAALAIQTGTPSDTLFGRWVHVSGLAVPLVVMGFAGQWVFPALAGAVAGDIFAAEDRHGTWKALHCRSYGRLPIFVAKALVGLGFALVSAVVLIGSSLAAGLLLVGRDPLVNLSGTLVGPGEGNRLVALSLLSQLPAVLAMAALALMLSVVTRNGLVGVAGPVAVGLACQLLALADLPPLLRQALPSGAFTAWRGLWLDDPLTDPVWVGAATGLALAGLFLAVACAVFVRRDVVVR